MQCVFQNHARGADLAGQRLEVVIAAALQEPVRERIELGLERPEVLLVDPVHDALIGDAAIDGGEFQHVVAVAAHSFGTHQARRVVAGEIGARQVAVGHLSGQPLGQGNPHRLRDLGHEHPQVASLHQDDLAAFGSRLGDHDHRIFVSLGKHPVLAQLRRLVRLGAGDADVHLEALGGKPDLVCLFNYTFDKGIVHLRGWRIGRKGAQAKQKCELLNRCNKY